MPGWGAFRACLLLAAGETESWASVYLMTDIAIVDASVQAHVINAQDGVTIFEVLADTPVTFAAGVPQGLDDIGGAAWTPAAANKHAVLRVRISGGTPALEALDGFWACPVIDFPEVTSVLDSAHVDGAAGEFDADAYAAAYEAGRNSAADPANVLIGGDFEQFGATVVGTAPEGGGGWDPDEVDGIDTGLTARQALRLMVAVLCGKSDVSAAPIHVKFRDTADEKDRVDATMSGTERSSVAYDKT